MSSKTTSPLTTFGRDEAYIENKLHLLGASSVILHGVGDGMIPYCCLMKRIPCLLIYGKRPGGELHQKTIQKFLVDKVQKKIEEAAPGSRWYRTTAQLGCREEPLPGQAEPKKEPSRRPATPAPKKAAQQSKAEKSQDIIQQLQGQKRSSSSNSSSSSKSKKSKKSKKE